MPAPDRLQSVFAPVVDSTNSALGAITGAFAAAGYALYIVGGAVRDIWLGQTSHGDDIDLTTEATPQEILRLAAPQADAVWRQGERFGTIGLVVAGKTVEITTHRAEVYSSDSRKPGVQFGTSLRADLARRDFTINAVAVSLIDGAVHDPFGGLDDLDARLLRTPLAPEVSFGDDPLRILRAARFIPRFGLTCAPDLLAAAQHRASRVAIVSAERIRAEFDRLLALDAPRSGLSFLFDTEVAPRLWPELVDGGDVASAVALDGGDVGAAVELAASPGSTLVRRAGFFSPLGTGADRVLRRMKYSTADRRQTVNLIRSLKRIGNGAGDQHAVRSVVHDLGMDLMPELETLSQNWLALPRASASPSGAQHQALAMSPPAVTKFWASYHQLLGAEDLSDLSTPLTGEDVMELLGCGPGRQVGAAIRRLQNHRLAHGPVSVDEAKALITDWESGSPT